MARLIPKIPLDEIALKPERDVAQALIEQLPPDSVVYHSYPWLKPDQNIRGNTILREGEADFVIVMPDLGRPNSSYETYFDTLVPALHGESRQWPLVMRNTVFCKLMQAKTFDNLPLPKYIRGCSKLRNSVQIPVLKVTQYPIFHEDERNGRDGRPLVIG